MTPVEVPEQLRLTSQHSAAAMVCGKLQQPAYRLAAVIDHTGPTVKSGHYTAQCRAGNVWFDCNDATTSIDGRSYVPKASSEAYVLLYEKQL